MTTLPLIAEIDATNPPAAAFASLSHLPGLIFFDSALPHPALGRYSFIAADPFEWMEVPADGSDGLAKLKARLSKFASESVAELPPFQGGAAGLFSYELAHSLESLPARPRDQFGIPAVAVGFYDVVVAYDHQRGRSWILSQGFPETEPLARQERATQRLHQFHDLIQRGNSADHARTENMRPRPIDTKPITRSELEPQFAVSQSSELTSNFSAQGYRDAIGRVIEYIRAGDVFQVNLSQTTASPRDGRPLRTLPSPATEEPCSVCKFFRRRRVCDLQRIAGEVSCGPWSTGRDTTDQGDARSRANSGGRPVRGRRSHAERKGSRRKHDDCRLVAQRPFSRV